MIGRLRGELLDLQGGMAVVDAGGVGYEVSIPESLLGTLPAPGSAVELWTRQVFREDGVFLYGFGDAAERRLFDLLVEVKGCGPKIALALIGQVGPDAVVQAIALGDPKPLTRATGVGPRLAERIALELRDKIQAEALARKVGEAAPKKTLSGDDVVEALLALGYRRNEAEAAAAEAEGTVEERVRAALRKLAR